MTMSVHDWTRVSAGTFHDFHVGWIGELRKALNLNRGILPEGFYALAEQLAAPPMVHTTAMADEIEIYSLKRRTLTIRYSGDDRIVALVEILSPGNKERRR